MSAGVGALLAQLLGNNADDDRSTAKRLVIDEIRAEETRCGVPADERLKTQPREALT